MRPVINYQMIKGNLFCRTKDCATASELQALGWRIKLSELGKLL